MLTIPIGTALIAGDDIIQFKATTQFSISAMDGHSVTWETIGEPESMDPHISQDNIGQWVRGNIYETLYTYPWDTASNLPTVYLLAADAPTISADGLNYTASLRTGITFHDGSPFNASCVKYNIERLMAIFDLDGPAVDFAEVLLGGPSLLAAVREYGPGSPEHISAYNNWVNNESIIVLNDYQIRFRLNSPFTHFIYLLASEGGSIISPTFIEANGGVTIGSNNSYVTTHASGTGPYRLVDWVVHDRLELRQNEMYWRAADALSMTPNAGDIVNVTIMTNRADWMIWTQIEHGNSDGGDLPLSMLDQVWNGAPGSSGDGTIKSLNPDLKLWAGELTYDEFFLGFNQLPTIDPYPFETQLNPFANKSLRQAFSYAFNYSAFLDQNQYGLGDRLSGPVPSGIFASTETPEYEFNLTAAAEKWNEAMAGGWLEDVLANCSYKIEFVSATDDELSQSAFIILRNGMIEMLTNSSYGAIQPSEPLSIEIMFFEWQTYQERYEGRDLSLYFFEWHSHYPDPHDSVSEIVGSHSQPAAIIGLPGSEEWNSSYVDASILSAARETYPPTREDLYLDIQEQITNHSAYLWLTQLPAAHLETREMFGYTPIPNRGCYFYHLWKLISPTITPLANFELELGTSDYIMDWTVSAETPANYSIYRNGTEIAFGSWTGTSIQYTIGPLGVGLYNFTLVTRDENSLSATDEVFVTVLDTVEPSATATHVPLQPTNLEAVDVTAFVEDYSDIVNVTLSYSVDSGASWTSIEMTQNGANTWIASIPAQVSGTNVAYKVYAHDEYDNQGVSPTYLYSVIEAPTTSTSTDATTPTTPTTPSPWGPGGDLGIMLALGGLIGGLVVIIVILFMRKSKS
jgi:peptide/nickel transport system substrate-binding protein